ncbi:MAG: hypothetical protein KBC73_23135 [Burkholderiaceae bacterium]|nr:hypothetical protein [Burkholderiaceae bacterium]
MPMPAEPDIPSVDMPPPQAPPRAGLAAVHALPLQRRRHLPALLRLLLVALAGALIGASASYLLRKLGL